jgi:hypothetical protein
MDMQNRVFNGNLIKNGGIFILFFGIYVLWTPPSCMMNVNLIFKNNQFNMKTRMFRGPFL